MTRIRFQTDDCSRCGGTGRMPYSAYGGVCFKCNGHTTVMTRAGVAARKAFLAARAAACTKKRADEVQVGDRISLDLAGTGANGFKTVVEIQQQASSLRKLTQEEIASGKTGSHGEYTRDESKIDLVCAKVVIPIARDQEVLVFSEAAQATAIQAVLKRKGVVVVTAATAE